MLHANVHQFTYVNYFCISFYNTVNPRISASSQISAAPFGQNFKTSATPRISASSQISAAPIGQNFKTSATPRISAALLVKILKQAPPLEKASLHSPFYERVLKVLNLRLPNNLRNCGNKSRNSLATQTTLNFSGPCERVRPAKLTNHSARTNLDI